MNRRNFMELVAGSIPATGSEPSKPPRTHVRLSSPFGTRVLTDVHFEIHIEQCTKPNGDVVVSRRAYIKIDLPDALARLAGVWYKAVRATEAYSIIATNNDREAKGTAVFTHVTFLPKSRVFAGYAAWMPKGKEILTPTGRKIRFTN